MDGGNRSPRLSISELSAMQRLVHRSMAIVALLGCLLLCTCESTVAQETPSAQAADANGLSEPNEIQVGGIVAPVRRIYVPARVEGIVESISVRLGEQVDEGAVLVSFERRKAEISLREAELTRAAAEQRRAAAESGVAQSRIDLQIAEDDLERGKQSRERLADSVSDAELERRELIVARAQAEIELQQATLLAESSALELSGVRVEARQDDLADHALMAPFRGTVAKIAVTEGQWCAMGAPIVELIDNEHLFVRLFTPQDWASVPLEAIEVELRNEDGAIAGEVSIDHRSPEIDPVRQVVEWRLIVRSSALIVGQRVSVVLRKSEAASGSESP